MDQEKFLKWEKERTKGQVHFVLLTTLKFAVGYFFVSILFGPLWPILKGADIRTVLVNIGPISAWIRKIIVTIIIGLGIGRYIWYRTEKEYKKYQNPDADI